MIAFIVLLLLLVGDVVTTHLGIKAGGYERNNLVYGRHPTLVRLLVPHIIGALLAAWLLIALPDYAMDWRCRVCSYQLAKHQGSEAIASKRALVA